MRLPAQASLLENSQRKTYNELDRALAAQAARRRGLASDVWQGLLGCTSHQVEALQKLLDLPVEVQVAVDDAAQYVTITHALILARLKRKYPELTWREWIDRINAERITVKQLVRAVNERYGADEPTSVPSLFRGDETDEEQGVFRFQPIGFDVRELSREERMRVRAELSWVIAALDRADAEAGDG